MKTFEMMKLAEQTGETYVKDSLAYSHQSGFRDKDNGVKRQGSAFTFFNDLLDKDGWAEPPVDWSNVPVDTPVWVRNVDYEIWVPRYFAMFLKCGEAQFYAFTHGRKSTDACDVTRWNRCKLRKEGEEASE